MISESRVNGTHRAANKMSLIDKLSKEQIADFREAFSLFDHDENGSISHVELGQVLQALG